MDFWRINWIYIAVRKNPEKRSIIAINSFLIAFKALLGTFETAWKKAIKAKIPPIVISKFPIVLNTSETKVPISNRKSLP